MSAELQQFFNQLATDIEKLQVIKITLGNRRIKTAELKNIFIKPLLIKNSLKLSYVYRYPTKDITKNYDVKEGIALMQQMLHNEFLNADVFTSQKDVHLALQENERLKITTNAPSLKITEQANQHDKQKNRIIQTTEKGYLQALGITSAEGKVKKDRQDKYKQINSYVEIIDGIIKDIDFKEGLHVVDMGCGKGYLTFALYDYLTSKLHLEATVTGIELRQELVDNCNRIARESSYEALGFQSGTIEDAVVNNANMLIALHACDTATDDAIYSGIKANARVIICAPCCHKQIRKQMAPDNELKSITKHGILMERQAEIVTDAIRSLLLEAWGYKSRVFEFIATEHTPKNVLIVGVKQDKPANTKQFYLNKIGALKSLFGIQMHHLETLLERL
ncbi:SAM-dependent methyltransferase [Ferruginibacter paludis]|uniref:class I SAM-dependent methyltransferase n=1 Tax=Ferruginibacter paludis TaxID=1310417 RepID=UPI0025B4E68B|nr:SAM-dependent methyltransferase [Ferruginibacter paludis]MDN3656408.1 SAM-dependent methyltransferase [Ferruginibacter paludis]